MLMFISGALVLVGAFYLTSYAGAYPSKADTFLETSDFQSKFLKYVERTAVYCRYRESGYTPTDSNLYTATDLPSLLTDSTSGSLTPSGSVHVASQESFDYYNYLLNECNTNFIYFVKNLNTGAKYCSPYLAELAGGIDNAENYLNENTLKNASAYLKLNTQSKRYVTNVNRGYNYLNESNISWVINYLQDGLYTSSMVGFPTYKEPSDNTIPDLLDSSYAETTIPSHTESADSSTELTFSQDNGDSLDSSADTIISQSESSKEAAPQECSYVLYAYVLDTFPFTEDEFHPMYSEFRNLRVQFDIWIYYTPAALLCFVVSLLFALGCAGHKRRTEGIYLSRFDHIFTEIAAGLLAGITFLILKAYYHTNGFYSELLNYGTLQKLLILYILLYPVLVFGLFSLIRRLKAHSLIRDSLLYRILKRIGSFLNQFLLNRHLAFRAVLIAALFCLIQAAAFYIGGSLALLLLAMDDLLLTAVLVKIAIDLNIVMTETRKISEGDINHKVPSQHLISPARELSQYINNIQKGFSTAVEERLKSERLKTELITNVSHDIKTPLTSIINYVDLLNKQPLNNEVAAGYLKILTEKSWRLKNLIDDLVEASKASSGTLALHFERINVGELLKQAVGEFEDRFLDRGLEIVLTLSEHPLYVMADGRSTYRIIENLFSNVTKYALSGTRVYIDMREDNGSVLVSVKNISAARLNMTGEELMERFVRGDMSRNTEGSGLGLSIARSLALLQHGTFELILDGDLFKVHFTLPLCEGPEPAAETDYDLENSSSWEATVLPASDASGHYRLSDELEKEELSQPCESSEDEYSKESFSETPSSGMFADDAAYSEEGRMH